MFENEIETCHMESSLLLSEFSVKGAKARIGNLGLFSENYGQNKIKESSKCNTLDLV